MSTITQWEIIDDVITEDVESPSGTTNIEVTFTAKPRETTAQMIARGLKECYDYIDKSGYNCVRAAPHPNNNWRLQRGHRPVFCQDFTVKEDKDNPFLIHVALQWAVPEAIKGDAPLEREPPRRTQHVVPRISTTDPNTGYPHTNTAGEIIRNVQVDWRYGGLSYTIRLRKLPSWFADMQQGPINDDTVRLDGDLYEPLTLWCSSCTSTPYRIREGVYGQEISLDLLHDPNGWDEKYPNIGHYELLLVGQTVTKSRFFNSSLAVDVMSQIGTRQDAERFAEAARTGKTIMMAVGANGGMEPVKIQQVYVPIKTYLKQPKYVVPAPTIEDIDRPVMLDNNGLAFRELNDGYPLKTTGFGPNDLVTRSLITRLKVPFKPLNLW